MISRYFIYSVFAFIIQPSYAAGSCDVSETSYGDGITYVTVFVISKDGREVHRTIYRDEAQTFARDSEICGGPGRKAPPTPLLGEGVYRGTNNSAWFYKECSLEVRHRGDGELRAIAVQDSASIYNISLGSDVVYEVTGPDTVVALGQIGFSSYYKGILKNVYSTSADLKTGDFSLVVRRDSRRRPLSYKFNFSAGKQSAEIDCIIAPN